MGQALYRKYRPKSLREVIGQEHITETLLRAITSGRISHAYLFSGPKGVGKTSIARILAHEVNGIPYTDDSAHLDIIEIDAASNRRIDEIRDLRDKVYIAPTSGKYKVYIIDEVHMLTREAFNALLKTLEEPPAHVVFVLATTEAHKLPETIISRTQHYTFRPVDTQKVIGHLKHIAKQEKIPITDDALQLLAEHGQGSFRDSISLLDQAGSLDSKVEVEEVRQLLGIAPDEAIDNLIATIQNGTAATMLDQLGALYAQGLQAASIASQLAEKLRLSLTSNAAVLEPATILRLLRELIEVPASHNPARLLEIVLLSSLTIPDRPTVMVTATPVEIAKAANPTVDDSTSEASRKKESGAQSNMKATAASKKAAATPRKEAAEPAVLPTEDMLAKSDEVATPASAVVRALSDSVWAEVLNGIKKQYNTLYGVLRMAKPVYTDDSIELQFKFAFHQKRLNEAKNRQIIADFIKQVTGQNFTVVCTIHKDATPPSLSPVAQPPNGSGAALESISNIFGGGEVLNS